MSVRDGDRVVCVAILSRPVARMLAGSEEVAEVSRLASDGTRHAASMCLAAVTRAALACGWRRLVSYTLLGESGISYRAAGWWPTATVPGSDRWHTRSGRTIVQPGDKIRWETGPSAAPINDAARQACADAVGRVAIPQKRETLPLLRTMEEED